MFHAAPGFLGFILVLYPYLLTTGPTLPDSFPGPTPSSAEEHQDDDHTNDCHHKLRTATVLAAMQSGNNNKNQPNDKRARNIPSNASTVAPQDTSHNRAVLATRTTTNTTTITTANARVRNILKALRVMFQACLGQLASLSSGGGLA